jgi:peptide chain release factor 1
LIEVELRFEELNTLMSDAALISRRDEYLKVARERAAIEPVVDAFRHHRKVTEELEGNRALVGDGDAEIAGMAKEEIVRLEAERAVLEEKLKVLLLPKDPNDARNIFLEIRAGTGGDEAALFARDLFRMYGRFAEKRRWKIEVASESWNDLGGLKEVIALIEGQDVYSQLKYERGVHRVQRVPTTEAQGRIHTSAVTVAVLPEADEVDVQLDPKDLDIQVCRSGGPGGQSVNTTDSAVRVVHLPTNTVVICQDEKSQHKNKAKALKVLRSRLLERKQEEQRQAIEADRRSQVGTGDRSERVRTYNFPQSRMTDHRIGLTLYKLAAIMDGDLDETITALRTHYQMEALKGTGGAAVEEEDSPRRH